MENLIIIITLVAIVGSSSYYIYKAKKISVIREVEDVVNIDGEAMQMSKDITVEIKPLSLNILLNK